VIESLQLIAMYICTLALLAYAPRLLFVLMCFTAGYAWLGLVSMLIMACMFVWRH